MRVVIIRECTASPDHIVSRVYSPGEQFEEGCALMPEGLADILVKGGAFVAQPVEHDGSRALMSVPKKEVPAAKRDRKPVSPEWQERYQEMYAGTFGKEAQRYSRTISPGW